MKDNLVVCRKCISDTKNIPYTSPFQFRGFFTNFKVPENHICPKCKSTLEETNITIDEFKYIYNVSHDNSFLEAMIKLKETDPIEYQLKLSQFKIQAKQQDQIKKMEEEQKVPKCPYCNSTNIKKISGTERIVSTTMFGIFSKKIGKSFKCNNCGGTF